MIKHLPNHLRVITAPCRGDVCCCGFAIAVGTRDELEDEQGMAHFTEHLLFKGTKRRKAWQILNCLGSVGGEINAYTTKEEIFVYAICLKQHFRRAMELMCDMVFHSVFPSREIDNEREVVLDEINVYEDSPSELIYDDFERLLYPNHPFGRTILGSSDSLKSFDTDSFLRFTDRCFTTDRIVFFSLSSLSEKRLEQLVETYLAPLADSSSRSLWQQRCAPVPRLHLNEHIHRDTHQSHVLYGNKAYSLFEDKRIALFLLNNMLGGPGMNSRLNNLLREHNGLVYTVESTVNFYSDTGLFSIYFGTDNHDVPACIELINKELRRLRDFYLSDRQLRAAKKQLYGQLSISAENKESQALTMGKSMLYYDHFESMKHLFSKIEAIHPSQLAEVANEVFDASSMSILRYSPLS